MTDVTQGQDAPDDASLFSDATSTTLEKFENAEPQPQLPLEPAKPAAPAEPPKGEPPKPEPEAAVPPGRFREEAEARRRAERERDDLLRQIAAIRQPPPPQQPPPKAPDLFENPSAYVQNEVRPYFDQISQRMQLQAEAFSQQMAMTAHGAEKVAAAKQALTEGMHRGDPNVRAIWEQAMQSAHPYDVITRWHLNNETMKEVGGDLTAYRKKILEEAKMDPDYQRQVIEASKGGATHVARPPTSVQSSVPKIPSLGNVGAGGDTEVQEPSDEQLFRAAITAKRR
jgi:hypothetical protein